MMCRAYRTISLLMLLAWAVCAWGGTLFDAYLTDTEYLEAQQALSVACQAQAAICADPEAAMAEQCLAKLRVDAAAAVVRSRCAAAQVRAVTLFGDAIFARDQLAVARAAFAEATMQRRIMYVRANAGLAATREIEAEALAFQRALLRLREAEQNARSSLISAAGVGPLPTGTLLPPPLPGALETAPRTASVFTAELRLATAERDLGLAQGCGVAPLVQQQRGQEVDLARQQLAAAITGAGVELQLAATNDALARRELQRADAALATARLALVRACITVTAGVAPKKELRAAQTALQEALRDRNAAVITCWKRYMQYQQAAGCCNAPPYAVALR